MTVISGNLVLALEAQLNQDAGRLCYKNIVNTGNISATSEVAGSPVTNMANPSTAFVWSASSTATQTITINNTSAEAIDYIGFARHNLNQPNLRVEIKFNGVRVLAPTGITSIQAQLFLFNEATPSTIQIIITGASSAPSIGVLYVGRSVELERNIYVGHTPINYGRDRSVVNGVSQSGQWLGEVVLNQSLSTSVDLQNLTPEWYRNNLDPYFAQSPRKPCFWAWRPGTYPAEVGYCWVDGNPRPTNQRSNGMMQVSWNFRGIA